MERLITVILMAACFWFVSCESGSVDDMLDGRESITLQVDGNSMYPTIKSGEHVTIDLTSDFNSASVGDVIVFKTNRTIGQPYELIVHRIISVGDGVIRTKGDNNQSLDYYAVTRNNFIGIVKNKIDFSGKIITL